MSIDHGEFNLPFKLRSKTLFGETRAQFDRRTAMEEKRKREAETKQWADDLAACRKIIDTLSDERLTELGAKYGLTIKQTRAKLHSIAWTRPTIALRGLSKERIA